jgi:hypothetical protein
VAQLLLHRFQGLFNGKKYLHRASNQGDFVAQALAEDLFGLGISEELCSRIVHGSRVTNVQNKRRGISSRRGDGSFGELIPGAEIARDEGLAVARGAVATIEIRTEVKILAKAMIKQVDRVMGDLIKQVQHFRRGGDQPICVAIVGINHAEYCVSYEGDKVWRTDGKGSYKHPMQEAAEAERRIRAEVQPYYDELLILRYKATNDDPYPFSWVNERDVKLDYNAALARISRQYDRRFVIPKIQR